MLSFTAIDAVVSRVSYSEVSDTCPVKAPTLTDPEFCILLSLDDASLLAELLLPIVVGEPRTSRLPWRRWTERQVRPPLTVDEAARALTRLVAEGLVEIREVRADEEAPGTHPFDSGRALSPQDVREVLSDPLAWEFPSETGRDVTFWAAVTEAGQHAYAASSDARP